MGRRNSSSSFNHKSERIFVDHTYIYIYCMYIHIYSHYIYIYMYTYIHISLFPGTSARLPFVCLLTWVCDLFWRLRTLVLKGSHREPPPRTVGSLQRAPGQAHQSRWGPHHGGPIFQVAGAPWTAAFIFWGVRGFMSWSPLGGFTDLLAPVWGFHVFEPRPSLFWMKKHPDDAKTGRCPI